jgi:hypothetical protein
MMRSVNNPNTDMAIMTVLRSILPVNTALVSSSAVFIRSRYQLYLYLSQGLGTVALLLSSGDQEYGVAADLLEFGGYGGQIPINIDYYTCWDEDVTTIGAKLQAVAEDIERVKSNAEDNDNSEYQGTNHTMGIAKMLLGSDECQLDRTFPSLTMVYRRLTIIYDILPYGV